MPDRDHLSQLRRVVKERIAADSPIDMSVFWHPCGTFGCVAGWAARDPYFKAQGLSLIPGTYKGNFMGTITLRRAKMGQLLLLSDFRALRELFDLDEYQACYLFGNNPEITGCDAIVDWDDALQRVDEVMSGEV